MHTINKLFLATLGLLASYAAHAQVGLGTTTPRTMLDVNGAVSVAEVTATVASNAATIPLNYSLVRLTGTATAAVALTAASSPAPVAGQHLVIYNGLGGGYSATFAGQTIVAGQALSMLYSDGGWRPVVTSAVAAAGTSWGLAGNAGTTAGTNFLGTTDNVDLVFKRNNAVAAQLKNGITSFGAAALLSNTDSLTMAIGFKAGQANTSGGANQFVGYQSGYSNTTGNSNQFSGYKSGYSNTTGSQNQFSGYRSGNSNTTASYNLFIGSVSGFNNTTGNNNLFIGSVSGYNNTTGNKNLFIGYSSGNINNTGSNNTLLGFSSNVATANLTNATAIGSLAQVSKDNSLVLGSISGTNGATASTFVGIGTSSPSYPLDVQTTSGGRAGNYYYLAASGTNSSAGPSNNVSINAAGRIIANEFNAYSDARLKTVLGLSDSRTDLALVQQLQITDYQMRDKVQYGDRAFKKVIAQQVESVFPQAINRGTGFIPSIYANGTLRAGAPGQTLVTVPAAHGLKVGDRVRLMGEANGKIETTVLALGSPNTFAVALPQAETKLFVFGPEVADLRTVDYEALAMLNVSATQELARQVETLQAANAGLRASLADKASASTLTELQAALQTLRAEVQTLRAAGTTASTK